jgi:hypothetical protein
MKRTLLPLLTVAASMTIIACGSDSGANAVPSPGNTSAILQPSDCEKIMKALPVQPEMAYTITYDIEEDECVVVIPGAVDATARSNFLYNLEAYSKALVEEGTEYHYQANMGILFHRSIEPNQFTFNLQLDCKNAAYVANIPEKDSTWEAYDRCDLFTKSDEESYIYMTQPQWSERQAALAADGWMPIAKCNVSSFTGTICFQKQINDYIFELGYRPKEKDLMVRLDVMFEYQKI